MITRRGLLLGTIGTLAGSATLARAGYAFTIEEMPPHLSEMLAAACRPGGDSHDSLLASARSDLLARIAQGLAPANASEQIGCPVCGCSLTVTADGAL